MYLLKWVSVLAVFVAGPLLAGDDRSVIYSNELVAQCLDVAQTVDEERACSGLSAQECMDVSDYGYTTVGMQECTVAETAFWDARLNMVYREFIARAKAVDDESVHDVFAIKKVVDQLRHMQRTWIGFRDATCEYEYSQFQGGTIAGMVFASCLLEMTSDQAIYLAHSWPSY